MSRRIVCCVSVGFLPTRFQEVLTMWKVLLGIAVGLMLAMGVGAVSQMNQADAQQVVVQPGQVAIQPGWRFTGGHWNYWDPDDRAWYHTDGRNWYTYGDNAWRVYGFDRSFGRTAFRQGYVVPTPGPTVVVPRHGVFVP
jgi:hypothetical protein